MATTRTRCRGVELPGRERRSGTVRRHSWLSGAAMAALGACTSAWAEVTIDPSISVGASYIDNIALAPPGGQKVNDVIWQISPQVLLTQKAQRITSELGYMLQGLIYSDN